jgi:nitroimidazol reductase NimA-like FMN-containing flavoprotein (pyridoxamine 5'-phosphate oxidase superfamily)
MTPDALAQVLNDPLALELMRSRIPARLAYTAVDGTPRVIPIGFYWTGKDLVVATAPTAPKVKALRANPAVALTIDRETPPWHVLLVRGTAAIEVVDGIPQEYLDASRKVTPRANWSEFEAGVRAMYKQMAKITITPNWAKVLDFETRIPTFMERLVEDMQQ